MCHVLIIEDDALAATDIRETLERAGATAFSFAASEREAIQTAAEVCPQVITSDVMLERGSGPAAIRAIWAACGPTPVIFITATPDQCEDFADVAILEKPFHTGQLREIFIAIAPI